MAESNPERRCILTRKSYPADQLIRLVAAPDGTIVPDLKKILPGRGAWLKPDRTLIKSALAKGKLRGVLHRALDVEIAKDKLGPTFLDLIVSSLHRRCADRLGQALRSGDMVIGLDKIRTALFSEGMDPGVFLIAKDAGGDGRKRILNLAADDDTPVVDWVDRDTLSLALGKGNAVFAVVAKGRNADFLLLDMKKYYMMMDDAEDTQPEDIQSGAVKTA